MSLNLGQFIGNMTADPSRRYTPQNTQITTFGIAINKPSRRGRDDKPLFLDVETWDKLAEQVYDNGRKGRLVYVQGEFVRDEWEDRDTGKPRFKWYLKANVVRWLDRRGDDRDDRRDRYDDRDDRRRDDRDDDRRSRRDEEPRSRSNRDNDTPPPSDRDRRPDDDLPF